MDNDRYNKYYTFGRTTFLLEDYSLDQEDCCFLLLKMVEQAVRDYCAIRWSNIPYKQYYWETARDFIFDDCYFIQWGDIELNLETICELLDMEIDWVRLKTHNKFLTIQKAYQKKRKMESDNDRSE